MRDLMNEQSPSNAIRLKIYGENYDSEINLSYQNISYFIERSVILLKLN